MKGPLSIFTFLARLRHLHSTSTGVNCPNVLSRKCAKVVGEFYEPKSILGLWNPVYLHARKSTDRPEDGWTTKTILSFWGPVTFQGVFAVKLWGDTSPGQNYIATNPPIGHARWFGKVVPPKKWRLGFHASARQNAWKYADANPR